MTMLFLVAEGVSRLIDRVRDRKRAEANRWADDELSTI